MSEKKQEVEYRGRKKVYTDVAAITQDNVISVLTDSLITHETNRSQIDFLINYEKGFQPLQRERDDNEINVQCISNLAHLITEWWIGYFWGNHMAFVQKSDKHPKGSDSSVDDSAITLFNSMYEAEDMDKKDQKLAYFTEVVGVCPQMIDIKRNYEDGESAFDLVTLSPRYAYVVYSSDAYERPMMGVSYSELENGDKIFSCITEKSVFFIKNATEIINGQKQETWNFSSGSGQKNPFGMVNIIECERAIDRTGVFERQIDQMNALNILESDAVNNVAQTVQAVWWGNDFDFDVDEEGKPIRPHNGQFMLTHSNPNGGMKPDIKPLVMPLDYNGVLADVKAKREEILENAFVPVQKDQSGGSTTGATSLSSGWASAEAVACKKAQTTVAFYRLRNKLALKAIGKQKDVPQELLSLTNSDIDIRPIRSKTFDMATKVNSLATMINTMVHPRDAMAAIDFFPNLAETVEDSVDMMLRYQEKMCKEETTEVVQEEVEADRIMQDSSDQADNSPLSDL